MLFGFPYEAKPGLIISPDGRLAVAYAEGGDLKTDRRRGVLRIYRTTASPGSPPPALAELHFDSARIGPVVTDVSWAPDSSSFGFLEHTDLAHARLVNYDVQTGVLTRLTGTEEQILAFSIHDVNRFVFAARDLSSEDHQTPRVRDDTGQPLLKLLFPQFFRRFVGRSHIFLVDHGTKTELQREGGGGPVVAFFGGGESVLKLSPDGRQLALAVPVATPPADWHTKYHASTEVQDEGAQSDHSLVSEFAIVDLQSNSWSRPVLGPIPDRHRWAFFLGAEWSRDGKKLLLPAAFVEPNHDPCVTLVDTIRHTRACVREIRHETVQGAEEVRSAIFDGERVRLDITTMPQGVRSHLVLEPVRRGTWRAAQNLVDSLGQSLSIRQGIADPPVLISTDSLGRQEVLWDPNPGLKAKVGPVEILSWSDNSGRRHRGALYKPQDYKPGDRYPLVVQTHGFTVDQFRPSGVFPSSLAAAALAGQGFLVLQVQDGCLWGSPDEATCGVEAYRSGIAMLKQRGAIDDGRVGVVGFSRGNYSVLQSLTDRPEMFAAAIMTDGVTMSYLEYLLGVDFQQNSAAAESRVAYGTQPYGTGLAAWTDRSAAFHTDRIRAPLLINAFGDASALSMWQIYANLRYQQKPVSLEVYDTDEHVLTEPLLVLACQTLTVDWFRFWLKGEEDPDPAKAKQYRRWEELRAARGANARATTLH